MSNSMPNRANETLRIFDESTMSGVPPGMHTGVYHRVRIVTHDAPKSRHWFSLSWHHQSDRVQVFDQLTPGREHRPTFELSPASGRQFLIQLLTATTDRNWHANICGTCRFWEIIPDSTPDDLPAGVCTWPGEAPTGEGAGKSVQDSVPTPAIHTQLAVQSCLALECSAWTMRSNPSALPSPQLPAIESAGKQHGEDEPEHHTFLQRVKQWFQRLQPSEHKPSDTHTRIVEHSGVGAGTEPCPICHGRLANLGSTVVTTRDGDDETLSVWRCRICHTLYLNDWIDRWKRLASLETEETIYRVSPLQAARILYMFNPELFGASLKSQHAKDDLRQAILSMVRAVQPVVYQVKQGR